MHWAQLITTRKLWYLTLTTFRESANEVSKDQHLPCSGQAAAVSSTNSHGQNLKTLVSGPSAQERGPYLPILPAPLAPEQVLRRRQIYTFLRSNCPARPVGPPGLAYKDQAANPGQSLRALLSGAYNPWATE